MKYKVMYRMSGSSIWHTEGFDDESQALKYVEDKRNAKAETIEVYRKARVGYIQIKKF